MGAGLVIWWYKGQAIHLATHWNVSWLPRVLHLGCALFIASCPALSRLEFKSATLMKIFCFQFCTY